MGVVKMKTGAELKARELLSTIGKTEEDRKRIFNALSLMMNGNQSVACKNCGAVAFLDKEELEAFKVGKLACGQCNEILKENGK